MTKTRKEKTISGRNKRTQQIPRVTKHKELVPTRFSSAYLNSEREKMDSHHSCSIEPNWPEINEQEKILLYFVCTRTPHTWVVQRKRGEMRYICHLDLRSGRGAWGFRAEEGNSQAKAEQVFVIRCLPCHTERSLGLHLSLVQTLILVKTPNLHSFR